MVKRATVLQTLILICLLLFSYAQLLSVSNPALAAPDSSKAEKDPEKARQASEKKTEEEGEAGSVDAQKLLDSGNSDTEDAKKRENFSEVVSSGPVYIITISGAITPATDDFLKTSIEKAEQRAARLLVVRLDTPGGLLTSMQTMSGAILEAPMPTVVYVSPGGAGAISAGVFVTMAAHFAVMSPGTTIGAAHPVTGGGGDVEGDMGTKVENFAVSLIKTIAKERDRNIEWAEKAVRESVAITDSEAVDLKVVDFVAADMDSLLSKIEEEERIVKNRKFSLKGVAGAERIRGEMSFKQEVVALLADPNIAILLGLLAFAGIGIELYHPGGIIPGLVGGISLILSLISSQVVPIRTGGVLLLLLGGALFVAELFIPSFGVWGICGIICLVLGSIYFVDTDVVWSSPEFSVNMVGVGTSAAVIGILLLWLCFVAIRTTKKRSLTGAEALIGKQGRVIEEFRPVFEEKCLRGKVSLMGEIWHAELDESRGRPVGSLPESDSAPRSPLEVGEKVVVTKREGLLLYVTETDT